MFSDELIQILEHFQEVHGELAVLIDDGGSNPAVIENAKIGLSDGRSVVLLELI